MSTSSLIVLLVTITMVTARSNPDGERLEIADAVGKLKTDGNAMKLFTDFNDIMERYICSLPGAAAQKECPGIQDLTTEMYLLVKGIDCSATPDNEYCLKAEAKTNTNTVASEADLEDSLMADADAALEDVDFSYKQSALKALTDMVCALDAASVCDQFRAAFDETADLESKIQS